MIYLMLFAISFASATLLPSQSELFLGTMIIFGNYNILTLITIASVGNILGSITNYYIGRYLTRFENTRFVNKNSKIFKKATALYEKYGKITLFFAWVPVIGDPLTIIGGFFRVNFKQFVIIVSIGKILRYIVVAWIAAKANTII